MVFYFRRYLFLGLITSSWLQGGFYDYLEKLKQSTNDLVYNFDADTRDNLKYTLPFCGTTFTMMALHAKNYVSAKRWLSLTSACTGWNLFWHECEKSPSYNSFDLPQDLHKIKSFELKHLRSSQQVGDSCVLYSILNARSLQDVVQERKKIDAKTIEYGVQHVWIPYFQENIVPHLPKDFNVYNGLNRHEMHEIIKKIKLANYNIVEVTENGSIYISNKRVKNHVWHIEGTNDYEIINFEKFIEELLQQGEYINIILTVPSDIHGLRHAVLLSIIKRKNQVPLVIYLDSNNYQLSYCKHDYAVSFFVAKILMIFNDSFSKINQ